MTAYYDNYGLRLPCFTVYVSLTVSLKEEKDGVSVCRIYGIGTIAWENSALDWQIFQEIK